MTEAKDYLDFLEQHRLMDDAQKYPLAVEYARSCEREIVTLHEERDRLRDEIERAAQLAVEAKNTILKLRGALDLAQTETERDRLRAVLLTIERDR